MTQQARNLAWQLDEEGIDLSILLHDRDRKFAASFDRVFESGGARVVLTPLMAPRAYAHMERWIVSCRRERLDWMLVASEGHLRRILREYVDHYNQERPHRSRELRPPSARGDPGSARVGNMVNRSVRSEGCYLTITSEGRRPDEIYEPHREAQSSSRLLILGAGHTRLRKLAPSLASSMRRKLKDTSWVQELT